MPNLVSIGKALANLKADKASRMSRAKEQGFSDRSTFRGIAGDYDPSKAGYYQMFTSSAQDAGEYGKNIVEAKLRHGRNLEVEGRGRNFNNIYVGGLPSDAFDNLHSSVRESLTARTDDIAHAAQAGGYDSVTIKNIYDKASNEIPLKPSFADADRDILAELGISHDDPILNGRDSIRTEAVEIPKDYGTSSVDIIFDPSNIRSVNAMFDPAKKDSSNLLASAAGAGILGAGAMQSEDAEAGPMSKFGQLRDARKQLFDTAPMSREVAEVFANEKSRNLIRDESELRKTKTFKWRKKNPPSPELVEASKRGMPGIGRLTASDMRNFNQSPLTDLISAGAVSTAKEIAGFVGGAMLPEWGRQIKDSDPWFDMGDQAQGMYDAGAQWMGENVAPTIGRGINAFLNYERPVTGSLADNIKYVGDQYDKNTSPWGKEHVGSRIGNALGAAAAVWPGSRAVNNLKSPNSMVSDYFQDNAAPMIEEGVR